MIKLIVDSMVCLSALYAKNQLSGMFELYMVKFQGDGFIATSIVFWSASVLM